MGKNTIFKDKPDFPDPWKYRVPSGSELRVMRKYLGLSQNDVAKMADVSQRTISGYEREDSSPKVETLNKILALYRIEFSKLVVAEEINEGP